MVPIKGEWTTFADHREKIKYLRLWGLISPKATKERPVMVVDGYFGVPEPCEVVGYKDQNWAVIRLPDGYHAIFGEYLAEMQPQAYQKLPYGMCFAEVMRDYITLGIKTTDFRQFDEDNVHVPKVCELRSEYIVFDIETTGFSRTTDEIIEFAGVKYTDGVESDRFHTLIKPNCSIPPKITALTGISDEAVASAPAWDEVSASIQDFIGNTPLIGHNVKAFDVPFLESKLGIALDNKVIDTLPLARKAFPDLPRHKLDYLKSVLDLGAGASHRADSDVETTHALLLACLDAGFQNVLHDTVSVVSDDDTFAEIIEFSAIRYSYGKETARLCTRIRPSAPIPAEITKLTGVTDNDVANAPGWPDASVYIRAFLGDLPLFAHNGVSFVFPFLSAKLGGKLVNPKLDTRVMVQKALPLMPNHRLDYLKSILEFSDKAPHQSENDAEATNALLWACLSPRRHESAMYNAYLDNKMIQHQERVQHCEQE